MASFLVVRLCTNSVIKSQCVKSHLLKQLPRQQFVRFCSNESKESFGRVARRQTLKERAYAPATETPFSIGKGVLAGGSLLGLGALCYYGLGTKAVTPNIWPEYVKDRIRTVYLYFGGSIIITAASAMASFRSPVIMNLVTKNGFVGLAISIGAMIASGILCQSIQYKEGFGAKQMAWMFHSSVIGAMLAPMCFLGGPILIRAAWYTAGVIGGLSTLAVCAPSEKFLNMGAPLAMGLGVVFASSMGSMFFPPSTALGAGLYSISLYGGLLLFSAFLLYDTQKIMAKAKQYPPNPQFYGMRPYDPINESISIYLDAVNIFIRIAMLVAGGNTNQRK